MKVVWEDTSYYKEKPDVRRSVDMAVATLKTRLTEYVDNQNISVRKIFGDDVMMHEIINKYFYVYKCKVNQMQIRILYTMRDDEVAGWVRSLQLRAVELPDELKDEVFLIVGERRR